MNLITYEPHGMNKQSEIEKTRAKMKNRKIRDTKRNKYNLSKGYDGLINIYLPLPIQF